MTGYKIPRRARKSAQLGEGSGHHGRTEVLILRGFQLPVLLFLAASLPLAACLEPPSVGKAADPQKADSAAPVMGGATNLELAKKISIIEDFLDGKLSAEEVQKRLDDDFGDFNQEMRTKRLEVLQEALKSQGGNVGKGNPMPAGPARDLIFARYYFTERRFIEAGELLSGILDVNPAYSEARILLARCFYFLGNPDRTLQELQLRLQQLDKKRVANQSWTDLDAYEYVDALFLIGAAVLESPGTSRENLETGKRAWETYLQMAPKSEAAEKVEAGLAEMEAGIRGEGRLAQAPQVRGSAAAGGGQGGVTGGAASFKGGGAGPAPKKAERVKNLPKDAPPFEREVAAMLDALDTRNIAGAQAAINKADAIRPGQPVVATARARAKVLGGEIPDGLRLYGEIIKRFPTYVPAWHYMGMAHLMSGDPGQAAKSWEKVRELDVKYFKKNNLERRVQVAKRMAKGG